MRTISTSSLAAAAAVSIGLAACGSAGDAEGNASRAQTPRPPVPAIPAALVGSYAMKLSNDSRLLSFREAPKATRRVPIWGCVA